jgi:hypothetical protein
VAAGEGGGEEEGWDGGRTLHDRASRLMILPFPAGLEPLLLRARNVRAKARTLLKW